MQSGSKLTGQLGALATIKATAEQTRDQYTLRDSNLRLRFRWADAQRHLEEGIAQEMPYPSAETRLLHIDGQRCAEQGECDQAQVRPNCHATLCSRSTGAPACRA
jgi:hypothetical protein